MYTLEKLKLCFLERRKIVKKNRVTNICARDEFLFYLCRNASLTGEDEYPILKLDMVSTKIPQEMVQWDCRYEVKSPNKTAMSFYCTDSGFTPILNNPHNYVEKLRKYQSIVGLDASPYDNMSITVQKSQIYANLATSYYFGSNGLKIIPNLRLGDSRTIGMIAAVPKECMICIGANGFLWKLSNRKVFKEQVEIIVHELRPSIVLVYGIDIGDVFDAPKKAGIPIYFYMSHSNKRNRNLI